MSTEAERMNARIGKLLSRRAVLKYGLWTAGAGLLAACGQPIAASLAPKPTSAAGSLTAGESVTPASPTAENYSGVTLQAWTGSTTKGPAEAAAQAWGKQTGGKVVITEVPFEERALKYAGLIATQDSSIDILYGWTQLVAQYGAQLYEDLGALGVDTSDFVPAILPAFTSQGKLRLLPLDSEELLFLYNKDYFEKAGLNPDAPPTSWDELYPASSGLTSGNRYPCSVAWGTGGGTGGTYWNVLYNSFPGAKMFSDDRTQLLFDNDQGLEVWQTLDRGFKANFFDPAFYSGGDDYAPGRVFNGGGTASLMGWSELWGQAVSGNAKDFGTTIDKNVVGATIMPGVHPNTSGSINGFEAFGLNKFGKQKQAALSYLTYMSGPDFQKGMYNLRLPSARVSVLNSPEGKAQFPVGSVLSQQGAYNLDRYATSYDWVPPFTANIQKLIKGQIGAEQAHQDTIAAVNKIIVDYLSR